MSTVKAKELRALSPAELNQKKESLEKQLFELRQKKVTGQLDKPHFFKRLKKEVARIHTLTREQKNG